jgi:hypothetical protein
VLFMNISNIRNWGDADKGAAPNYSILSSS